MWHNRKMQSRRFICIITLLFSCWVAAGCVNGPKHSVLQSKNKDFQIELSSRQKKIQQLEKDNAGLKIQVLEYESLIKDLQDRSRIQQQRLDAAIVEVVRSKARLRSLESKAEAASTIAEAEIAVSGLKKQAAAGDKSVHEEISKADQLLKMSTIEFQVQNFGGALYLASQAKRQARAVLLRLGSNKTDMLEGETLFAQPLPLKCIKNSNLRSGPGIGRKIVGTLGKGELVVGHSYKESWVHVETQDGQTGWLHQSLIGVR